MIENEPADPKSLLHDAGTWPLKLEHESSFECSTVLLVFIGFSCKMSRFTWYQNLKNSDIRGINYLQALPFSWMWECFMSLQRHVLSCGVQFSGPGSSSTSTVQYDITPLFRSCIKVIWAHTHHYEGWLPWNSSLYIIWDVEYRYLSLAGLKTNQIPCRFIFSLWLEYHLRYWTYNQIASQFLYTSDPVSFCTPSPNKELFVSVI